MRPAAAGARTPTAGPGDRMARLEGALKGLLVKHRADGDHLEGCRISRWQDGYGKPNGAPCSEKCAEIRRLLGVGAS